MHWKDAIANQLLPFIRQTRVGLVTDVDGTISPIVDDPDAAQVTPRNRELLHSLRAHLTLVAVISGRTVTDVRNKVNVPGLVYIGNHGLEWWVNNRVERSPDVQQYRPAIEAALHLLQAEQVEGMFIENKDATLSVHYRTTPNPHTVETTFFPIVKRIATEHGLKVFKGRMVFELRPPIAINKGSAFRQIVEQYQLDAALYLGDDTTDADALTMARQLRQEGSCHALGMAVLSEDTPDVVRESADLSLSGVADVEAFLSWLLNARKASST